MPIEENKALVRRYFEDAPYHPEVCDEIFAEQLPWHILNHTDHPDFISSPQAEKEAYARHISLWGTWSEFIDEMICEGERVMVRWTLRATQRGEYMGIPPTHMLIIFSCIYIFRIANQRIAEVWNLWDRLGEWQQLGILPGTQEILHQKKN